MVERWRVICRCSTQSELFGSPLSGEQVTFLSAQDNGVFSKLCQNPQTPQKERPQGVSVQSAVSNIQSNQPWWIRRGSEG